MGKITEMTELRQDEKKVEGIWNDDDTDVDSDPRVKKWRWITTAVIYYCSCALGITMTFLGPAILHFKNKYQSSTAEISLVYTISIVSSLVCGLAFGVIFSHVNRHALITVLMAVLSILIILAPYCPSILLFYIMNAVITICCGGFLISQIVWTMELWNGNPIYLQAQAFCFSLGTVFPPLIFGPFLSHSEASSSRDRKELFQTQNSTLAYQTELSNKTDIDSTLFFEQQVNDPQEAWQDQGQVNIPCAIIGTIGLIGAALLFILLLSIPKKVQSQLNSAQKNSSEEKTSTLSLDHNLNAKAGRSNRSKAAQTKCTKVLLVLCTAIFAACFIAIETSNGQFLPIFGFNSALHLSEAEGAQLLFAFTMAFMVGRLMGILISSFKITPRTFLFADLACVFVGNCLMFFWGTHVRTLAWIGAILVGFGFSTGAPSVLSHVQGDLKIGNFVGAVVIVTGKLFSTLYALVIGTFIDEIPTILMYTNFTSVILGCATFVGIYVVMRRGK